MKKIYFNDKWNQTAKFLLGEISMVLDGVIDPDGKESVREDGRYFEFSDGELVHTRWRVGEQVAVAMSYEKAGLDAKVFGSMPGWGNKTMVNAKYLPYFFVVESVRCVRVQDLKEEDALRLGVSKNRGGFYMVGGCVGGVEEDWRVALERLFNLKASVPYALNPWVVVYEVTPVICRK